MRNSVFAVVLCGLLVAASGCAKPSHSAARPGDRPNGSNEFGLAPDPSDSDGLGPGTRDQPGGPSGDPGGPSTGPGDQGGRNNPGVVNPTSHPATPTTPYNGPVVVYFRLSQQPVCPKGASYGSPAIVEWKLTGTDVVTLSVDGPGLYGTYGATGSQELGFGCGDVQPGQPVHHTVYLNSTNNGIKVSRTLVMSAKA